MSATVQIDDRDVLELLSSIDQFGSDGRYLAAETAARTTRKHFRDRGGSFYEKAAGGTTGRVDGDDIVVSIDHVGIALRYFGGTVEPTGDRRFLAIPDEDNAQERNNVQRHIDGLHFRPHRNKHGEAGRLVDEGGRVFYWLTQAAEHDPDPTVLPSDEDFARDIIPELKHKLERI